MLENMSCSTAHAGKLLTLLIFVVLQSCKKSDQDNRESRYPSPNIVMVLVDDLRWDEFGAAGHNYIKTPHIDRIVGESTWFKNAFTTTPLCSPSRASFLTGQYAHTHGVIDNTERGQLSHQLKTFPAELDSLGYETAFIGKWHMGNDNTPRRGFDTWVALKGQGEAYHPEFNVNGTSVRDSGYVTDLLTGYALTFLEEKRNDPFMLYLSHKGLHPNLFQDAQGKLTNIGEGGFVPAKRHAGMYRDKVFSRRPNAFITPTDKPALMRKIGTLPPLGQATSTPENVIRERAEMLMAIDEGLGRILNMLEKTNQLDNTVIVLAGDNGYFYGEHGLNEERRLAYEEAARIPLMIRYTPMTGKGSVSHQLALNIDVAPTLLELAGKKPNASTDGKSLVPLLKEDKPKNWRTSFLMEYYSDAVWPRTVNLGYRAVRTERYKYIQYSELKDMDELYDLETDPYELTNQIRNAAYLQQIEVLKKELTLVPKHNL
jgi:N-acetylglucosamine-6-sulfatase